MSVASRDVSVPEEETHHQPVRPNRASRAHLYETVDIKNFNKANIPNLTINNKKKGHTKTKSDAKSSLYQSNDTLTPRRTHMTAFKIRSNPVNSHMTNTEICAAVAHANVLDSLQEDSVLDHPAFNREVTRKLNDPIFRPLGSISRKDIELRGLGDDRIQIHVSESVSDDDEDDSSCSSGSIVSDVDSISIDSNSGIFNMRRASLAKRRSVVQASQKMADRKQSVVSAVYKPRKFSRTSICTVKRKPSPKEGLKTIRDDQGMESDTDSIFANYIY